LLKAKTLFSSVFSRKKVKKTRKKFSFKCFGVNYMTTNKQNKFYEQKKRFSKKKRIKNA
jgi:hypothetical protein